MSNPVMTKVGSWRFPGVRHQRLRTAAKTCTRHPCAPEACILQYSGLLDAGTALMASGFTVVTNTTKHSAPMANVARLKTSFISAPIHFPFRAEPAHQQPALLPILMPPDFRNRHLRDGNAPWRLATAMGAAWFCVVARPCHGATRRPGWLVVRVPLSKIQEGMMRIARQNRIHFARRDSWSDCSLPGGLPPASS